MTRNKIKSYDIVEILGDATPTVDLQSDIVKGVIRSLMTLETGDELEGIDIRKYKKSTNQAYSGIRLSLIEAHRVADILVSHGFGTTEVLEEAVHKRKDLYTDRKGES